MARRIIQFGTSRFLQAHADLFVHEAREAGQDIGPITIVKTTAGIERAGRIEAFARAEGFPVVVRGYAKGELVDRTSRVTSVDQALSAMQDWAKLIDLLVGGTDIIFSNVGDSGYKVFATDRTYVPSRTAPPDGFPAKLLALLHFRFAGSGERLLMLPCELITGNGTVLRQILLELAANWQLPEDFTAWLGGEVIICDTLVDRIVSEAIEPIGAIAEPYALWAVAKDAKFPFPFTHPSIVVTENLEPYVRLKLHILNLGHTFLADIWLKQGRRKDETVREILADGAVRKSLVTLYSDEVVPGFAAHGMGAAAAEYVDSTIERFDNPFLNHRISDIAENHALKVERRAKAFIDWSRVSGRPLAMPRLERLLASQQSTPSI